ncbi:MAG: hypothetical protein MZU84_01490 [Sphingobacterium sp.]|nr:hypothetical protein [Sphingobacterium sp.]
MIFDALEQDDIHKIIDIELSHLYDTDHRPWDIKIVITPEAKDLHRGKRLGCPVRSPAAEDGLFRNTWKTSWRRRSSRPGSRRKT